MTTPQNRKQIAPFPRTIRIEKNLAGLGFFTPSHKTLTGAHTKKIVGRRHIDGQTFETRTTIAANPESGLPTTADQDKYIALLKIINDVKRTVGVVTNPVRFTSQQILDLLGVTDAGKNFGEIEEWLRRMVRTTVESKYTVYFKKRDKWVVDMFHVFDRAVAVGRELADGKLADCNYVWLSDWQLENINENYLLPLDFESYRNLRTHIAKALAPLLQIWLYASQDEGRFEKSYNELAQFLRIKQHPYESSARRQLSEALNEFVDNGYLASWTLETVSRGDGFKVTFYHGKRFFESLGLLGSNISMGSGNEGATPEIPAFAARTQEIATALVERGVTPRAAHDVAKGIPPDIEVTRLTEWLDSEISHVQPVNAPGFVMHLLKNEKARPPKAFETRADIEAKDRVHKERAARESTEYLEYEKWKDERINDYLQALGRDDHEMLVAEARAELVATHRELFRNASQDTLEKSVKATLSKRLEKELALPSAWKNRPRT